MPIFSYIAVDGSGKTINGTVEQTDRNEVINALIKQGFRPISVKEGEKKTVAATGSTSRKKIKSDQLVMFTRQLSAMISAGVPILRALSALADHVADSPALKQILEGVIKEVEGGATLGDALAKYPATFNEIYVNMVRAGEAAGILDDVLKRLAIQQEKSSKMKKKVKSAMAYPMVLLFITIAAFFGLMIFVIPMIGNTVKDLAGPDAELPMITQVMLSISGFIISFWYIIFPIIGAIIVATLRYIKTPGGKRNFHTLMVRAPILGAINRKLAVARFTRTFSALTGAGVAVLEGLDITAHAVGNVIYQESLQKAAARVKNGEVLSKIIMEDEVLYPPIVSQMLAVGEETGQTDKVLVKVADFYEEEVDTAIAGLSSTIEPVMIVFMGGMVGLIAASVMLPITGMANQIKG